MAVAKIIFKLGAKRLSAAQKRALAKAIKASALKRARKANFKTAGLKMKRARLAAKYVKSQNKLQYAKLTKFQRDAIASQANVKKLKAYDKLTNPSKLRKGLGLFDKKSALKNYKKFDRNHIRATMRAESANARVSSLKRSINKLDNKDLKLMRSIDKSIRSGQSAVKEAEKYAKISGTKINKSLDLSYAKAQREAMGRAFDYTFYGAVGAAGGLKALAIRNQNAAMKNKKKT